METFSALPTQLINDDDNYYVDPATYNSLFQFDFDLQRQAQATLPSDAWPDFNVFLPDLDNASLFFGAPTNATPPSAGSSPPEPNGLGADVSLNPIFDPMPNTFAVGSAPQPAMVVKPKSEPTSMAPSVVMSQWTPETETAEYSSLDNQPFSPPESTGATVVSNSVPQFPAMPPAYTIPADTPHLAYAPSPPMENMGDVNRPPVDLLRSQANWPVISSEPAPAKVPIQRLKAPAAPTTSPATPAGTQASTGGRQQKRTAHNAIERRYRNNINDRITELKNAVPALLHAKVKDSRSAKRSHRALDDDDEDGEDSEEYLDGVAVATKLNKATILRKATEYITHLKQTGDVMQQENKVLQHLLSQMPGGRDVLSRYQMQKMQREQEMQRQRMLERQMMRERQQLERKANRKRARTHTDEYESSSSGSAGDPPTPPAVTQRVFMALFACLTFLSDSPLTTGPSAANDYQNHNHVSRTADMEGAQTVPMSAKTGASANNTAVTLPFSLGSFESGWHLLRTVAFVLCLVFLLLPVAQNKMSQYTFHVKRVPRVKRTGVPRTSSRPISSRSTPGSTAGEQKCRQMYMLLHRALAEENDAPPIHIIPQTVRFVKEALTLISRHLFGFAFVRNPDDRLVPEDEWEQACRWVKLCELANVGGNPGMGALAKLHMCCHMINLVDDLDDQEQQHADLLRSRAYATAAMQFSLVLPQIRVTQQVVHYFWQMAVDEASADMDSEDQDDQGDREASAVYMRSLQWVAEQQDDENASQRDATEYLDTLFTTPAWQETLAVMQPQANDTSLSLSFTAPVLIPIALFSTLHMLDHLRLQYSRLMTDLVSAKQTTVRDDSSSISHQRQASDTTKVENLANDLVEFHFEPMVEFLAQSPQAGDAQRVVHWLATVGLVTQALWYGHMATVEKHIRTVLERVPRAITTHVASSTPREMVNDKLRMSQLDELRKRSMVYTLLGAALIKQGKIQEGTDRLRDAENVRINMKRVKGKKDRRAEPDDVSGLEASVMAMSECAVAAIGLEAWITAWKQMTLTEANEERIRDIRAQVGREELYVRRMIGRSPIQRSQAMIKRLARLGLYVAQETDEVDSACDCSDVEDCHTSHSRSASALDDGDDGEASPSRRAARALDILHGV